MNNFNLGLSIKPKLGIIYKYQKDNNLSSKELSRLIGVPYNWFNNILNLKHVPKTDRSGGNVEKIINFF
jgi:hypothetical protein